MAEKMIQLQDLPLGSAIFPPKKTSISSESDELASKTDISSILEHLSGTDDEIASLDKKIA